MADESAMERSEVSAAKDTVLAVLGDHLDSEEHDLIGIADAAVKALLKGGVLIPEWMIEAWEGRKVTPVRVTGR